MNLRNVKTLKGTRLVAVAFQVRLSVGNVAVSTEVRCGTPPVNIVELYGNATTSSKMIRSVKHSIYKDTLKRAFLEAFNSIVENKGEILKNYEAIIQALTDTSKLDKENVKLQSECEVVAELLRKCIEENAYNALNQAEYQSRYTGLVERYEVIKKGLVEIDGKRLERSAKRESIESFIRTLKKNDALLTEFDEELWNATVETVKVNSEHDITLIFKDGKELEWNI